MGWGLNKLVPKGSVNKEEPKETEVTMRKEDKGRNERVQVGENGKLTAP